MDIEDFFEEWDEDEDNVRMVNTIEARGRRPRR